jgi:hypothetical protein
MSAYAVGAHLREGLAFIFVVVSERGLAQASGLSKNLPLHPRTNMSLKEYSVCALALRLPYATTLQAYQGYW